MAAVPQQREVRLPENKVLMIFSSFRRNPKSNEKTMNDFFLISKKTVLVSKENTSLCRETQI